MYSIYGGGVVGYCLAAHFEKFNIPYKLFTKEEKNDGYGLTIQEADNIIHFLQLKPDLNQINYLNRYVKINGCEEIIYSECHSKGNYVIPRSYLIELFESIVNKENIIKLNSDVLSNLTESDNSVRFNIGTTEYESKYLIGCDGIHSKIRKHIMKDDILIDTEYIIMYAEFKDSSKYKFIQNDVIEYISDQNKIRIFIKPNGMYGASIQIVYPNTLSFLQLAELIPRNIYNHIDFDTKYESKLYTSRKIIPDSKRILLCGDAIHPMIPYHGSGANCGIINTHLLANIIKLNEENISEEYYEKINYVFDYVNESFNTFYKIHYSNVNESNNADIYVYDKEYLIIPIAPKYNLNDKVVQIRNNFTEIILAGIDLDEFPEQLYNLSELRVLNMNDNNLTVFPKNINLFNKLEELYLRNNKIKSIPSEIKELNKLSKMRLSYNLIENVNLENTYLNELCLTGNCIANIILKCNRLKKLYCSDNQINQIDLSECNRLRYLRVCFNPLKLSQINSLHTLTELKELRIDTSQNDIHYNRNINIKYGYTLNKEERKYYDGKKLQNISNQNKNEFIMKLKMYIVDNFINSERNKNLKQNIKYDNIIKLNLLNCDNIIDDNIDIKLKELFLNRTNLPIIMKLFTLYITENIILSEKTFDKIKNYIEKYFNTNIIDFIIKQKKHLKLDPIKIQKTYSKINISIDLNNEKDYPLHKGFPINPESGRPKYYDNKCYYKNCTYEGYNLESHLIKNVDGFIHNYHQCHEDLLHKINKKIHSDSEFKCPVKKCNYNGDMKLHLKQLGFKPYWNKGDTFSSIDNNEIGFYSSDECVVCMDSDTEVLLGCGHKVLCMNCFNSLQNMECILCRYKIKYFFIY